MAYLAIDAGIGALILFGGVQLTMFAGAVIAGEAMPSRRWIGAALAMAGLAWLVWPTGAVALPIAATAAMLAAALGWGVYSLVGAAGRRTRWPRRRRISSSRPRFARLPSWRYKAPDPQRRRRASRLPSCRGR